MATVNITGSIADVVGTAAAGARLTFRSVLPGWSNGDALILGEPFVVTADGSGDVDFDAEPGEYQIVYQLSTGEKVLGASIGPDDGQTLASIINATTAQALTTIMQTVLGYKNDAEAAAVATAGDALATAVDRVQTGQDRAAAASSAAQSGVYRDQAATLSAAAGAPSGEALPTLPDAGYPADSYFRLLLGPGTQIWRNDSGTWVNTGIWERGPRFNTVALLLADTSASYGGVGTIIEAGGFRYSQAASGVTDHHVTTAGGVLLYVLPSHDGSYDLGALNPSKIGAADTRAKLQALLKAANSAGINAPYPGSTNAASGGPRVRVPSGVYLFESPVDLSGMRHVHIECAGVAVFLGAGTKANGFATAGNTTTNGNLRYLHVEGIHFQNLDTVFSVNSGNLDQSMWVFERCYGEAINLFLDTHTYSRSRSTLVTFNNCVFKNYVAQISKTYCDHVSFNGCWLGHGSDSTDLIYGNSLFTLSDCMLIPPGVTSIGKSFVYLTNSDGAGGTANDNMRGVFVRGLRASNEGGNGVLVVNDFPVVDAVSARSPIINIDSSAIAAYHPSPYETGNSESGVVYLKQYPASVSFSGGNGFIGLGGVNGKLVAKSDALVSAAPAGFCIEVDEASFRNACRAVGVTSGATIATSLRGYINNPDPFTFDGASMLEDGHVPVAATATAGQRKATFKLRNGFNQLVYATPIAFRLYLGGVGTAANNSTNYSGVSIYEVQVSGFFDSSAKVEITTTKVHGSGYGNARSANCNLISAHFGTADTGASTAARVANGEYDITFAFGTGILFGMVRIEPLFRKPGRYLNPLYG